MKIIAQYGCYENGSYKVLEILELEDVQENCSLMVEEVNNKMKTIVSGRSSTETPILVFFKSDSTDNYNFFMNMYSNPMNRECIICNKVLMHNDNLKENVCCYCEEKLPNKTGYCSLSCRLGNGCDDSC